MRSSPDPADAPEPVEGPEIRPPGLSSNQSGAQAKSEPPVERERIIRGIPLWLVRGYLEDLGARPTGTPTRERVTLAADTWGATLEQVEDFQIGSLRVGQVRLVLTGEDAALRPMLAALEKRLFRGGG